MAKFLFIDDDGGWLERAEQALGSDDIAYAECRSTEEALKVISQHEPEILFLDHQLSGGGSEGFAIVAEVCHKGIKIYSTTGSRSRDILSGYMGYDIEFVRKGDFEKFAAIIARRKEDDRICPA